MAITFNSVPTTAAASAVFVEQEAVNRVAGSPVLQRRVLIVGQYNAGKSPTANTPQLLLNESDAWDRYGRGSMLAAMYKAVNDQVRGAVPIYALPLADNGTGVAATGTIAVTGTATAAGTLAVYVAGTKVPVAVASGDTATAVGDAIEAAVNAKLDLPVTASNAVGTVTFTARFDGTPGNSIGLEVNRADTDETPAGISTVVTGMGDVVAGANDSDATTALANLGDTWYTDIVYPYSGDTELDILEAAGVVRAGYGVKRMFAGFVGWNGSLADLTTALGDRNSEWTTYVPVYNSPTPAYVIAAAGAGVFARVNQATPGRPSKGQVMTGVVADDANDLTYSERDTILKAGGSTTRNTSDGRVIIEDLATTRTTTDAGADTDDWRFTVIIPNLQFKINALEQTFSGSPFDQAVVVTDDDPPGPTYAVRPKTVLQFAKQLIDDWISRGLSTDRETILENTSAEINASNPGRIDLVVGDVASAGLRIVAVKLEWGFVA